MKAWPTPPQGPASALRFNYCQIHNHQTTRVSHATRNRPPPIIRSYAICNTAGTPLPSVLFAVPSLALSMRRFLCFFRTCRFLVRGGPQTSHTKRCTVIDWRTAGGETLEVIAQRVNMSVECPPGFQSIDESGEVGLRQRRSTHKKVEAFTHIHILASSMRSCIALVSTFGSARIERTSSDAAAFSVSRAFTTGVAYSSRAPRNCSSGGAEQRSINTYRQRRMKQ